MNHYHYVSYYFDHDIKRLLVLNCSGREFAMLSMKGQNPSPNYRYLNLVNEKHFDSFIKCSGMKDKRLYYNMYHSVALYMGEPFTFIGDVKAKQKREQWVIDAGRNIVGYDLIIDVDAPNFDEIKDSGRDAYKMCEQLTRWGIPFTVAYSGMGFHIKIPHIYISHNCSYNPLDENNVYQYYSKFAKLLRDKISDYVDTIIYDDKRLIKIIGTLAVYPDAPDPLVTGYIRDLSTLKNYDYRDRLLMNMRKDFNPLLEGNPYLHNSSSIDYDIGGFNIKDFLTLKGVL